ncbi:hypothetical protein ACSBR2_010514 [Camellia fascicularis]
MNIGIFSSFHNHKHSEQIVLELSLPQNCNIFAYLPASSLFSSSKMNRISIWVALILFSLLLHTTKSNMVEIRNSLMIFYRKLSNNSRPSDSILGWNMTSDPCKDSWFGVYCDEQALAVKKIDLGGLGFTGTFDASTICNVQSIATSLTILGLSNNGLGGENLDQIASCRQLTHLNLGGNRFSGSLPDSLSMLNNLIGLDIWQNNFSGNLPDLARISGLQEFLAQHNQLTGPIPKFDFQNFMYFNISFNNFTGHIPFGGKGLPVSSFIMNPELCGPPLPKQCPSASLTSPDSDQQPKKKSKKISTDTVVMFVGYFLIGLALFVIIVVKLCKRGKTKEERSADSVNKVASVDNSFYDPRTASGENKAGMNKSGISAESGMVSSSLVILTSPEVNGLKFDDLLKAPAELIGRGRHGTVYKVVGEQGMPLAVKRIRDWMISSNEFKQRMQRLGQVKHPNVLSAVAFYCSQKEKLLVYQYQENGSLFRLLHGTQMGQVFDWSGRLGVAATITEALSFMHQELRKDGIAHGNLKSSNILLTRNMEPCISEYGLMMVNDEDQSSVASFNRQVGPSSAFKSDIYGLGVILLELLTGKMVQNNGLALAQWVLSVVQEEWTVEVFDKTLIQEGASEESMLNLLQIAVKCVDRSPKARPSLNQIALMINNIKEEEERSIVSEQ